MHIDRRLVGFGLFLTTVGGVDLGLRLGLLVPETVGRAPRLWPLILERR